MQSIRFTSATLLEPIARIGRRIFVAIWLVPIIFIGLGGTTAQAIEDTLVPQDAVWRYLDDGSDAGVSWIAPSFDDSGWASGPAKLGYAVATGQATVVSFGPDPDNKYATTYFRHSFTVADPSIYSNLTLKLLRDDSAIVYLNGAEIHRVNLPAGPIGFQTTASFIVNYDEEFEFFDIDVDPTLLTAGDNTLAVEIHRHAASYDLAFDLQLLAGDAQRVPELVRGPYLQELSPTRVVIRWRTDIHTTSAVRYGSGPDSLTSIVTSVVPSLDHEIVLNGLSPGSTVYYSVGTDSITLAGEDATHYIAAPPPVGTRKPTRIWVTGDSGHANFRSKAVRDAYLSQFGSSPTDLWLLVGDNAYPDGTDDQFQVALFDIFEQILQNTPAWPAIGNHESHTASSANQTGAHFDNFTLPTMDEAGGVPSGTEAYYSFDYANIHFICLDSEGSDRSVGGPMLTWLAADLDDTQQEWIIAYWHHPPYSHGSHDSDIERQMIDMRTNALPILEAGGVDLVLAGHSHSYERSMLIDGYYGDSTELLPSMILDEGDGDPFGSGQYVKPGLIRGPHLGAVYVVTGSSSSTKAAPLDHPVMVRSLLELGSLVIDIGGNEMNVQFLNDSAQVTDRFAIYKPLVDPVPSLSTFGRIVLALLAGIAIGSTLFTRERRRRCSHQSR